MLPWLRFLAGAAALASCAVAQPPPAPPTMGTTAPLPAPHFIDPKAFDFVKLLPPPPARVSLAGQADLEVVLHVQTWRTPEEVAWAKVADTDQVFNLAEVLGPWFTREKLPLTDAFFKDFNDDLRVMDRASKAPFQRPRPHVVDARVQPCVRLPTSTSYPSGTALQACAWTELFAEIFPEKRAQLEARAQRIAWGRVLGGVHFPTDLTAGRQLATPFMAELRKSAAFQAAWARCREEMTKARGAQIP